MAAVHFIDLEEINLQQDFNRECEVLRIRVRQAKTNHRRRRELNDKTREQALEYEELMNHIRDENKHLSSRVEELQQQRANMKRKWEDEEEEAERLELLMEEREIVKNQLIYIKEVEEENQDLRDENDNLTDERDQLLNLRQKYVHEPDELRTAEQELQHKLKEIQEIFCCKDKELEQISLKLDQTHDKIDEYPNMLETLRQEQRELQEERRSLQEQHQDKHQDGHHDGTTASWWRCAKSLWEEVKVRRRFPLGVLLAVGVLASLASVYNSLDADCDVWNIAFHLLQPYCEIHYTHPTVI